MSLDAALGQALAAADAEAAFERLQALASADDAEGLRAAGHALESPALLELLDGPDAEGHLECHDMRAADVMAALVENEHEAASEVLRALRRAGPYTRATAHAELLIHALGQRGLTEPETIAYWDAFVSPGGDLANVTIDVATTSGTPEAMQMVARHILDERHDPDDREVWVREAVAPARTTPLGLQVAGTVLASESLHPQVRASGIDALCRVRGEGMFPAELSLDVPDLADMPNAQREPYVALARGLLARSDLTDVERGQLTEAIALLTPRGDASP